MQALAANPCYSRSCVLVYEAQLDLPSAGPNCISAVLMSCSQNGMPNANIRRRREFKPSTSPIADRSSLAFPSPGHALLS